MTIIDESGQIDLGLGRVGNPLLDVVVLEDDALDAELLSRELRKAWSSEVRVSVFVSLADLENGLVHHDPDVIFCDLGLPDAQGIEVVQRVVGSAGAAPVVVLTGNSDPTIPVRALRSGAQDYLSKDALHFESLARALRYALARSFADGQVRRIADELREANGELDQYAGIVAHDLRAPIRTARLFTDRLKTAIIAGDDPIALTSCLESSLERIEQMIERLLRLATLRKEPPTVENMAISEVVEALGVYILADLEAADATLVVEADGTVSVDPVLFQELLLNLIHNSLKYAHPDRRPVIHFSVSETTDGVELLIGDNGIGIAPEHRERVFELFEQLDRTGGGGLGYGLSFCRRVAELHGGSLTIVDAGSDGGTSFRLWLPAAGPAPRT